MNGTRLTADGVQEGKDRQSHEQHGNELSKGGRVVFRVGVVALIDPRGSEYRTLRQQSSQDSPSGPIYPSTELKHVQPRGDHGPAGYANARGQI